MQLTYINHRDEYFESRGDALRRSVIHDRKGCAQRFMTLHDSHMLLEHLHRGRSTVVFHGHRHIEYQGSLAGKITILSARSTTLGDPAQSLSPGFAIVQVACTTEGAAGGFPMTVLIASSSAPRQPTLEGLGDQWRSLGPRQRSPARLLSFATGHC